MFQRMQSILNLEGTREKRAGNEFETFYYFFKEILFDREMGSETFYGNVFTLIQ